MTKAEMQAMMASVSAAATKAAEAAMMKLVTVGEKPAAKPASDDAKAKRLAGLEKARAAKAAKAAAKADKPAPAKQEAAAAKPAAVKGRKVARFKGNGQEVEVHADDKGYAVLHAVVNGVPVKLGAPVRLSSWRVLCCVIRSAAVQDMDKFMVENGLCDRDLA
jgi:hypothetical protein